MISARRGNVAAIKDVATSLLALESGHDRVTNLSVCLAASDGGVAERIGRGRQEVYDAQLLVAPPDRSCGQTRARSIMYTYHSSVVTASLAAPPYQPYVYFKSVIHLLCA